MSQFLRKLIAFALAYTALSLVLHQCFGVFMQDSRISRVERQFWEAESVDVLAMGDSYVGRGFATDQIPNSSTLFSPGESVLLTAARLDGLVDRLRAEERELPRVVVVSVGAHAFTERLLRIADDRFWVRYLDYPALALEFADPVYLAKWARAHTAGYAGSAGAIVDGLRGSGERRPERGWLPRGDDFSRLSDAEQSRRAAETVAQRFPVGQDPLHPALRGRLWKLARATEAAGIRLLLVRFPTTSLYAERLDPEVVDVVDADLQAVAAAHAGVAVELTLAESLESQHGLFFDADHLNVRGARLFTQRLVGRLEEIGWLESNPPATESPR